MQLVIAVIFLFSALSCMQLVTIRRTIQSHGFAGSFVRTCWMSDVTKETESVRTNSWSSARTASSKARRVDDRHHGTATGPTFAPLTR